MAKVREQKSRVRLVSPKGVRVKVPAELVKEYEARKYERLDTTRNPAPDTGRRRGAKSTTLE